MDDRAAGERGQQDRRLEILLLLLVVLLLGGWVLELCTTPAGLASARGIGIAEQFFHFDFLNFYTAYQSFIQHGEPYNRALQQQLFEAAIATDYPHALNFLYPPLLLVLLTPIHLLSFSIASIVWLLSSILVIAIVIVVATQEVRSVRLRTLSLVLGLTFAPFLSALYWGQLIPFIAALLFFSVRCFLRQRITAAGALIGFGLVKPQLCAFPLVGMCFLAWRNGCVIRFLSAASLTFILLSAGVELLFPGIHRQWLESIRFVAAHAEHSVTPTFLGLVRLLLHASDTGTLIFAALSCATALALLLLSLNAWRREKSEPELLNFCVLFATLFVPYAWFQDQSLLLLPALLVLDRWDEERAQWLVTRFLLLSFLATVLGQVLRLPQHYFVFFQLACICLYVFAMTRKVARHSDRKTLEVRDY